MGKTKLAEEKLASVGKLEEENTKLKAALDAANKEVSRLKNDKIALSDKASELAGKKNDLEAYLGGLAEKLFFMLEGNLFYPTDLISSTHHKNRWLNFELCLQNSARTSRRRPVEWRQAWTPLTLL